MSIEIEVQDECNKQLIKWGVQNHPNGTGWSVYKNEADRYKALCNIYAKNGTKYWDCILLEEVYEALSESDPEKLRAELIQAAAVIHTWIACIDRRSTSGSV